MQPVELGRLRVSKVSEMESGLPLAAMFPEVTAADLARVRRWCPDPHLTADPATSQLTLSFHSFVLQLDGLNVLVDACCGNGKTRAMQTAHQLDTAYLANLAAAGFRPDDIHLVMCTHLHFDHVGWNTKLENGRWVPTFPNARYLFARRDYEHWSTQEEEEVHRAAFDDSVLPVVAAGLAEIVDTDHGHAAHREIGEGLWLEPAYGHSPGSCLVKARGGGDTALFWGDVMHHPLQIVRPDFKMPFDHDADAAVASRLAVLESAAEGGSVCFPAHFRGATAGRVRRDGEEYAFDFVAA